MGERTGIAWTSKTWNPWQGCHKVSPGCAHCYMYSEKIRYGQTPNVVVRSKPPTFNAPLKWSEPGLVFPCSWSDWFIEEADPWRAEAWDIIRRTPHLTYQLVTKRPERIRTCLPPDWGAGWPNVWLLVSAERQAEADARIPLLLQVPAVVHGVSAEPLLGAIDLEPYFWRSLCWVIVGGESGSKARPMDLAWARALVRQCRATGCAVFVKQLGAEAFTSRRIDDAAGRPFDSRTYLTLRHPKGGDPAEWPEDLRVREFPEPAPRRAAR